MEALPPPPRQDGMLFVVSTAQRERPSRSSWSAPATRLALVKSAVGGNIFLFDSETRRLSGPYA